MAYFSQGESRDKLIILYFLRAIDIELTRDQLYRVFAEQGWMDYFDFHGALSTLEEDALVAAIPCAFGQGYRATPHGEDTLAMFEKELPFSLREDLQQYAKMNRALLRDQSQFAAYQTQLPEGAHLAVLRLMDKNTHILNISLQLPDAQLAQKACEAWPEAAGAIYQELLKRLV